MRALDPLEVFLVLDEHGERGLDELAVERSAFRMTSERAQSRLSETDGRLAQLEPADALHRGDDGLGQPLGDLRHLQPDDGELFVGRREVDEEMQAAALETVGQLARIVRRRAPPAGCSCADRAELGHRDLEVRQHLEQERLELRLGLVDLVDQEHDRIGDSIACEQRARREEAVREEGVVLARDPCDRVGQRRRVRDQLADPLLQELGVEELLGVLPLVERLALVEPFVALQADEPAVGDLGQRLRQLRLADARGPFDEDGAAHARGEEHHGRDAPVGDVARVLEMLLDVLDGLKHVGSCLGKVASV